MKKRARVCLYIFLICSVISLAIVGYLVFNNKNDNVMIGSKKFVTFNSVDNATSYSVKVKDNDTSDIGQAIYSVRRTPLIDKTGKNSDKDFEYVITVEIDNQKKAEETYVQHILKEDSEKNKIDCKIEDYTINFFIDNKIVNTRKYLDQKIIGVDKNSFCITVSEYFDNLFNEDGEYTIVCTPLDEEHNEIKGENNSSLTITKKFNYQAFYKEDFLRRPKYYIDGEWYDYVIDDTNELNKFVWWNILYRQSNKDGINFFINTPLIYSTNINNLVFEAINNYPEYDGLKDNSVYGKVLNNSNIGSLVNFDYYLSNDFILDYRDLEEKDFLNDTNYYKEAIKARQRKDLNFQEPYIKEDVSTTRTFPINTAEEVEVYNTEQLFMVVQSGAKPKFMENNTVVEKVYNNAIKVLKNINNSDLLSDYEKALNIYRYLTSEIIYDYVTYDYMKLSNDYSIKNYGNFSCFYLEGVFYNTIENEHYAVCDGLAKAYSLMCNIEGIDCIKVNGIVKSLGNHAWNRVNLVDEEYEANGYYYVDTTWGEGSYRGSDNVDYQILTHEHFLFKHDADEREILYPKDIEQTNPSSDYDYYKSMKHTETKNNEFKGTFNQYIESDFELKQYFNWANSQLSFSNKSQLAELKFSYEYLYQSNSLLNQMTELRKSILSIQNRIEILQNRITILEQTNPGSLELIQLENEVSNLNKELKIAKINYSNWFDNMGITNDCEWLLLDENIYVFRIYKTSLI